MLGENWQDFKEGDPLYGQNGGYYLDDDNTRHNVLFSPYTGDGQYTNYETLDNFDDWEKAQERKGKSHWFAYKHNIGNYFNTDPNATDPEDIQDDKKPLLRYQDVLKYFCAPGTTPIYYGHQYSLSDKIRPRNLSVRQKIQQERPYQKRKREREEREAKEKEIAQKNREKSAALEIPKSFSLNDVYNDTFDDKTQTFYKGSRKYKFDEDGLFVMPFKIRRGTEFLDDKTKIPVTECKRKYLFNLLTQML